jgi:hypothetical protein
MPEKETDKLPIVVYKKLGNSRPSHTSKAKSKTPYGQWVEGEPCQILVDPRQAPKEMIDTIVHEVLHEALKETTEEGVERIANLISSVLWKEGYRKVQI